jgi:hypothetical protein
MVEFEKEKWNRVAAHLKTIRTEKEFNPKFLKRTFNELPKNGL